MIDPGALRNVRTFDEVVEFLIDELDWPIEGDSLDSASFDWTPDELGIPAEHAPKLVSIRELRPMTVGQPWGIFFLEFSGPRLPITALRRLLQSLLTKKRAGPDRRTWDLNDLLFVVTTDTGESVELHLVAFFETDGSSAPEVRSLPWRPEHSPELHLRRIANELLPHLSWPEDGQAADAWRKQWREAFKLRHGDAIRSAARLAERMADTAHLIRETIADALDQEYGRGPFSSLLLEVQAELVASLDEARFADMCAQTLVYGTLTSRIMDPEAFGASPALSVIPLSNPFLAAFFEEISDQTTDLGLEEEGLGQLVADLRESDVEHILDQFGSTAKGGDPVIHFYEEFLKRYDRRMRADSGAFYTPQPVVRFIVGAVDEVLRTRFGLEDGIADGSTWSAVSEGTGCKIPSGVDPADPFVSMVDPATGTGTFLVQWLRLAHERFRGSPAEWQEHLHSFLLRSMHAFELMLAPYAIAHLKVALELELQGVEGVNPDILLTDALDHPAAATQLETMEDPVAVEGRRAADLKREGRFTVVIGNPPYDREQKETAESGGKRKGGVVRHGVPGIDPLLDAVIGPLRQAGLGKHAKNVYNDYVYFLRWATWQATERRAGPGVVAFITASSYLDGNSFGGLRKHLRDAFDELWIIDLGGEGRGARPEENVFEIRTPVAICIGVCRGVAEPSSDCVVRYLRIQGTREEKFRALFPLKLDDNEFAEVEGAGLGRLIARTSSEYDSWPEITELMPLVFPGTKAGRTWVISPTAAGLNSRLKAFIDARRGDKARLFKNSPTGRKAHERLGRSIMPGTWDEDSVEEMSEPPTLSRYGYRSFDRQHVIADPRFLDRAGRAWSLSGSGQLFLTTLTSTKLGRGPVVTATPYVPDLHHFSGREAKNVLPLWRTQRLDEPNLAAGLTEVLGDTLGVAVSPQDFVSYLYALTGTPAFAARFAGQLDQGAGPVRLPLSADAELWSQAVELGSELIWLHTWGERFCTNDREMPMGSARELDPVRGLPERVEYDEVNETLRVGTGTFAPVSPEIWSFEVSGMQVVRSWLGYRMKNPKGKKSSPLDQIGPSRWSQTEELLLLLATLERTVELTPRSAELLSQIVGGPLIAADSLPVPGDWERRPPRA